MRLKDFENDAYLDTGISALLERIKARPFSDNDGPSGNPWDTEVHVTLDDGRKVLKRIDNMVGRSGEHAMSIKELDEKFSDCANRALPEDQVKPAFDALMNLEKAASVRSVIRHLQSS